LRDPVSAPSRFRPCEALRCSLITRSGFSSPRRSMLPISSGVPITS
jgi:hypothetical protein